MVINKRRLADGDVHCAGSATYQICFRLPNTDPNLTLNPNLNHITDSNPNPNPKINQKTKPHRNKIQRRVISKSRFHREESGFIAGYINRKKFGL